MNKENRKKVLEELEKLYGGEKCGLDFTSPFELLIATMLSAQCTDVRVNIVTGELFKEYNTPEALLTLNEGGAQGKNQILWLIQHQGEEHFADLSYAPRRAQWHRARNHGGAHKASGCRPENRQCGYEQRF